MARSGQRQKQQRTTAQKATADGLCSALFVFLFAWLDEVRATNRRGIAACALAAAPPAADRPPPTAPRCLQPALWVAPSLGLSQAGAKMALVLLLLIAMGPVAQAMGGALFNPANNAFVYARGDGSVWEHLVRSVAQALGCVAGAQLALAVLPPAWAK